MSRNSRHAVLFTIALLAVVLVGSFPADAAKGGKKGKPGGGDPPPPPPLPPYRYQITYIDLPAESSGTTFLNDMNNLGQCVGWYGVEGADHRAFLYDPTDPENVIDLNVVPLAGVPEGFHLSSAVGINDNQVVVGYLKDDLGNRMGYALDLGLEEPVIDLLPDLGTSDAYGRKINNSGDILGVYTDSEGVRRAYVYNPGLYDGDPDVRAVRDGTPQDLSSTTPQLPPLTGQATNFYLNNPLDEFPAQIAGVDEDGVAFRYTLDATAPETFPEIDLYASGIYGVNDAGTLCGLATVPREGGKGKNKTTTAPFRYNSSLEALPQQFVNFPGNINFSGDIHTNRHIYRDDTGWLDTDLLIDDSDPDSAAWFEFEPYLVLMNNRDGMADAAQLMGKLKVADNVYVLFVLTPVPVEPVP